MDSALVVAGIFLGYLLGSIPSAYIVLRVARGADIRNLGTGNVGALNTYQQVGPVLAAAVLAADVSKGVIAVLLPLWMGAPDWARFCAAVSVLVGHSYPVFLNFRGGKGAATILGVGLAQAPVLTLISLSVVVVAVLVIRNVVVGVALAFILFNVLTITRSITTTEPWLLVLVYLALTVGVVGNYMARQIGQKASAIRRRQWRGIVFPQ